MNETRKVSVTVDLAPLDVLLLDATATHLGKDRSAVVAEALRCFFIVLPRPDDVSPSREDESGFQQAPTASETEASK